MRVLEILNVTTCFALIIAVLRFLPREEFKIVIRELSVIVFSHNVSDLNPNEAELMFSKVANDIANKTITSAKHAIIAIKNIYRMLSLNKHFLR